MTNSKKGAVLWFTGLSGAGKSTVADSVFNQLKEKGIKCDRLDGDDIRVHLNEVLGFSEEGRKRNIEIAGFIAGRIAKHGIIVLASFISPYREQRNQLKQKIDNFTEVYVATPLDTCEERDVKGLYKKARAGEIKNFTGIDDPYEAPDNPHLILNTHEESIEDSSIKVINFLRENGYLI